MDPARMFKESLTSRPELENSLGQSRHFGREPFSSGLPRRSQLIDATLYLRGKDGVLDGTEIS